jgi:myo-inositol-1-phosphate synthase
MGFREFWQQWLGKHKDKSEDLKKEVREVAAEVSENVDKATQKVVEVTDKVWEEIAQKTDMATQKLQESELGKTLAAKAEKLGEEVQEGMSSAGEVIREAVEKVMQKVNEPKEDPFKKYEKSHEESSHIDALKKTPGMDQGSFFDKASRFAAGDYEAVKSDADPTITPIKIVTDKEKQENWSGGIHGYTDQDGDGDPLIDDAEIEDEK